MKDLVIISAGDFARETAWAVERINQQRPTWNLLGFVDDYKAGQIIDGYPVLGAIEWLQEYKKEIYVTCAIGAGKVRKRVWDNLANGSNVHPATIIDPAAIVGKSCAIGEGSIICAGSVLTIAINLGFNCILNLNCTIGHDAKVDEYCTVQPGTNISGCVHIGACTDIGTGSKIIQGKTIVSDVILGAGTVVCKNIIEPGTYVGVPAKRVH